MMPMPAAPAYGPPPFGAPTNIPPPPPRSLMAAPVLNGMPPNKAVGGLKRNPTPDELLKAIKPNLSALMAERIRVAVDVEKTWQYAQIRRNHLYYRGKQNLILQPGVN